MRDKRRRVKITFTYFVKIYNLIALTFLYRTGKVIIGVATKAKDRMEIFFSSSKLQKLCNSEKKLRGEYGPRMAALIQRRLMELADAEVLEIMRSVVGARCHELTGDLRGYLAVDLVHPQRLLFQPDDPPPKKDDGGLDWTKVKAIVVEGIDDYH